MMAWPCYTQRVYGFRSLAASAAVDLPVFKQILVSIGVIGAVRIEKLSLYNWYPD
jgi:hypothetical protein